MNLLDSVRSASRAVSERAEHVRIDLNRISSYAHSLPLERAIAPGLDAATHFIDAKDPESTALFFVTLDAINFGSGYFPHLTKRPGYSGYFTVAAALTDHYRANGPIPARRLAVLTTAQCTSLFGQDPANPHVQELMGLFAKALNDLGRLLAAKYRSSAIALVEEARGSAERLASLLIQMPFFDDVERYPGPEGDLRVPFYKRAQLTAADLALAAREIGGAPWGEFTDLDRLTIFADNLVPHVLRMDNVLSYDADLDYRIDAEQLIPAGSAEELELRASAVHAVELMVESLRASGRSDVTPMGLDYLLWNRGQEPTYKKAKPRHRTRTVFY
jgi:hypothetical protein